MEVTATTWVIALAGLGLILLLGALQLVAVMRPRSDWVVQNVYGGEPDSTDPKAYFAFNQGYADGAVHREASEQAEENGRSLDAGILLRRRRSGRTLLLAHDSETSGSAVETRCPRSAVMGALEFDSRIARHHLRYPWR